MKNVFIVAVIIIIIAASCKKSTTPANCELTTDAFAGMYKITKRESVAYTSGVATDQTVLLTDCVLSGIYDFRTDGTVTYTENGTCTGSGNGTWSISNTNLITSFVSGNGGTISQAQYTQSWDCTKIVLMTAYPSVVANDRYTLTRQ